MYLEFYKFELNPLDNKKRYRPLCTFQDISGQFSGQIIST